MGIPEDLNTISDAFGIPRDWAIKPSRFLPSVGLALVGLNSFASTASFNALFGEWIWWKYIFGILFSCTLVFAVVFPGVLEQRPGILQYLPDIRLLFMAFEYAYSFLFDDDKVDGFNLAAYTAFALMSRLCNFEELLGFFVMLLIHKLSEIYKPLGLLGFGFGSLLFAREPRLVLEQGFRRFLYYASNFVGLIFYVVSLWVNKDNWNWKMAMNVIFYAVLIPYICPEVVFYSREWLTRRWPPSSSLHILPGMMILLFFTFFRGYFYDEYITEPKDVYIWISYLAFITTFLNYSMMGTDAKSRGATFMTITWISLVFTLVKINYQLFSIIFAGFITAYFSLKIVIFIDRILDLIGFTR